MGTQAAFSHCVRGPADPRGAYPLSDNAFWLIAIELLDGVGAGIYQVSRPWLSRISCTAPAVTILRKARLRLFKGIGASISALAAGVVVDHFGYSVSFLALGAAAAIAFFVFFSFMPETRDEDSIAHDRETLALEGAASS